MRPCGRAAHLERRSSAEARASAASARGAAVSSRYREGLSALEALRLPDCPGRKPPFWPVKRPVRPYKHTVQNRFTTENAEAA